MSFLVPQATLDDMTFIFDDALMTFDSWIVDPDSVISLHGSFSSVIRLNGSK